MKTFEGSMTALATPFRNGKLDEPAYRALIDRQVDGGTSVVLPRQGELYAVMSAGAYGMSMASNYNSRPRPAEVLVDGEAWRVVREREKPEDLWRGERA